MSDDSTEVALGTEPAPKPRGRTAALMVGIVAVLGTAVFAGLSLADDGNAPEDPVRAMLEAVEQGDVLGALEQLHPGERDALRQPMTDLVDELNRLDVLRGADLGDLSGIEVTIDDLELASERLGPDVAAVTVVGGRGSYRFAPAELPLGGFLRDLIGDGLDESASAGEDVLATDDEDDVIATVKSGGRWYVSIGYSVAEAARRDAGVPFDQLGDGVTPRGADSPEDAVRELVAAAQEVDVRRMVELLPPGELSALHDYAALFLDDAVAAADDARGTFDLDVSELELDSDTSGDRARVFIRDVAFSARVGGGSITYEDGCTTTAMPGAEVFELCAGDDPEEVLGGMWSGGGMFGDLFGDIEPPELSFADEQPPYGIATVRVDGTWYVSPTRTILDNLVETVRLFEPADLVELRRFVEDVIGSFTTAFTGLESLPTGPDLGDGWDPSDQFDEACLDAAETYDEFQACFGTSAD